MVVELTIEESDSMGLLDGGEIDAYVSLDSLRAKGKVSTISKIGSSDYFFAVNKHRPDIFRDLDAALSAIQEENPFYSERLLNEYVMTKGA